MWEDEERFFAVYEYEIILYEVQKTKEISELERIYSEESIIGIYNTQEILYYNTTKHIYSYIKQIHTSILIASTTQTSLIQNIVRVPETSTSYKHLSHSYITKLYSND